MLRTIRAGNKVNRFHTVELVSPETVGHHSAGVAGAIIAIYHPVMPPAELMYAAIVHDLPEQATGDVPATAKWNNTKLKDELVTAEELWFTHNEIMNPEYLLSNDQLALLKFADMLDLVYKCKEELALGNQNVINMLDRGMDYCSSLITSLDSQFRQRCEDLLEVS